MDALPVRVVVPEGKAALPACKGGPGGRPGGWMANSFTQPVTCLLQGQLRLIMAPLDINGILSDIMMEWSVVWLKSKRF
jgi:hypothetical protein